MKHRAAKLSAALLVAGLALALCGGLASRNLQTGSTRDPSGEATREASGDSSDGPTTTPSKGTATASRTRVVTLAFAGDMHFQLHLAALLTQPRPSLGPITRALADADVTMVNLESAITERGVPESKELEVPSERYYFRTSPAALDFLDAAGADVVSVANNHGADYGTVGLQDTLRAARTSPVAVLGVGKNKRSAFTPHRVTVRGTQLAFLAADASRREGASSVWGAGPRTPGIADARAPRPRALLDAVRAASRKADVVVVYLHWGRELQGCPTPEQRTAARALADAGADVGVGSHAHVLLGSGWRDDTYVNYGLGNFLWYHNHQPDTGVLRLRIENGDVVRDNWVPARIQTWGRVLPLHGADRTRAVADWRGLRACTDLASRPSRPDASPR
jgi:poly-gamma-glutamate capsule biosynthesis protein CapA/YwtB (metallophosphatase superfamily)